MAQDTETKPPQEQERTATRSARGVTDSAQTPAMRLQEAGRLGSEAASRSSEIGTQSVRHLGEAAGDMMQYGARRTAAAQDEWTQGAARQFEATVGKLTQAMQHAAQDWRALMQLPTLAGGRWHDLNGSFSRAVERVIQTNLQTTRELFRAASPEAMAKLQQRFMRDYLDALLEGGTAITCAIHRSAEQTLEPLEQHMAQRQNRWSSGERVADVMERSVKVVSPDDSVQQASRAMREADIGVLPVGEGDRLVGMVTDRDITVRLVAEGRDPVRTKVRDVMTGDVRYVFEDEDMEHVAENMAQQQVRRLPVVNREKRLVGMVSLSDIAKGTWPHLAGKALRGIAREQGLHTQAAE